MLLLASDSTPASWSRWIDDPSYSLYEKQRVWTHWGCLCEQRDSCVCLGKSGSISAPKSFLLHSNFWVPPPSTKCTNEDLTAQDLPVCWPSSVHHERHGLWHTATYFVPSESPAVPGRRDPRFWGHRPQLHPSTGSFWLPGLLVIVSNTHLPMTWQSQGCNMATDDRQWVCSVSPEDTVPHFH